MTIEYDPKRDLLYVQFSDVVKRAARTEIVSPGVHADFDRDDKLVGIEILDASDVTDPKMQFQIAVRDAADEPSR